MSADVEYVGLNEVSVGIEGDVVTLRMPLRLAEQIKDILGKTMYMSNKSGYPVYDTLAGALEMRERFEKAEAVDS